MMARFKEIFTDPGLQMISFTITEKGYALYRPDGSLMPVVQADIRSVDLVDDVVVEGVGRDDAAIGQALV